MLQLLYTSGQPYDRISLIEISASTIAKKSPAQHIPNPTAKVPASVHVRRRIVPPKAISKPLVSTFSAASRPVAPSVVDLELAESSVAISKLQSIGDSCMAFLKNVKMLDTSGEMNLIQSGSSYLQLEAIPLSNPLDSFQEVAKPKDKCVVLIEDIKLTGLGLENKDDMPEPCPTQFC